MLLRCRVCGREAEIASIIGVCLSCIRDRWSESREYVFRAHEKSRVDLNLPSTPLRREGVRCKLCSNECIIPLNSKGYCGLWMNLNGKLSSKVNLNEGLLHSYLDPHPTNCCAAWFCPGGTGAGHPKYARTEGPEHGYYNLAVFFYGCNFNCLFCQNYSHKDLNHASLVRRETLVRNALDKRVTCVCYFGGSPEPQLPYAIKSSEEILDQANGVKRICWEWNGCGNKHLVRKAAELSFISGGNVKFDLKAYSEEVSYALSGVSNRQAFRNFELIYDEFYRERRELPVLTATTLLVPGYVDEREVEGIARFISELDSEIPYSLLVFYPNYYMNDLPVTRRRVVMNCYNIAKRYLKRVNIGNMHLLSLEGYYLKELSGFL